MYISFINDQEKDDCGSYEPNVHPFYTDTFTALYELSSNYHKPTYLRDSNTDWMIPPLKRTLDHTNKEPLLFFDVRTTEDFSSPAPAYLLLKNLALEHTSPLSIKGMGTLAVVQAFQITNLYLTDSGTALFNVAEEYHRFDPVQEIQLGGSAVSFLLSKRQGEMIIEEYGFFDSEEEMTSYLSENIFDMIYTDSFQIFGYANTSPLYRFLTDAFRKLSELNVRLTSFRTAFLARYKDKYGYYVIRKDGNASENCLGT